MGFCREGWEGVKVEIGKGGLGHLPDWWAVSIGQGLAVCRVGGYIEGVAVRVFTVGS